MPEIMPSDKQIAYVRVLRRKLHCPPDLLDRYTRSTLGLGRAVDDLNRAQVSVLIDTMVKWGDSLPPELLILKGQQLLPVFMGDPDDDLDY